MCGCPGPRAALRSGRVTAEQQPEERPDDAAPAPSGGALATRSATPPASAPRRAWDNLRDYVAHGGHLADTRRLLAGRRARDHSWRDLEGFLAAHDGDGDDG